MIRKINALLSPSNLLVLYWAMYWLMNGLDKFFNRSDLEFFSWHGKDRLEQFGNYFANTGMPEHFIPPLLNVVGVWEILIFFVLAVALLKKATFSWGSEEWLKLGLSLGAITFIIFSFFDVIFGDRAELLEHGTFLILTVVTYQLALDKDELKF